MRCHQCGVANPSGMKVRGEGMGSSRCACSGQVNEAREPGGVFALEGVGSHLTLVVTDRADSTDARADTFEQRLRSAASDQS
jgi:hypothetical protein